MRKKKNWNAKKNSSLNRFARNTFFYFLCFLCEPTENQHFRSKIESNLLIMMREREKTKNRRFFSKCLSLLEDFVFHSDTFFSSFYFFFVFFFWAKKQETVIIIIEYRYTLYTNNVVPYHTCLFLGFSIERPQKKITHRSKN